MSLLGTIGGIAGSFFGGPLGGSIGSALGNAIGGGSGKSAVKGLSSEDQAYINEMTKLANKSKKFALANAKLQHQMGLTQALTALANKASNNIAQSGR